jgi:hypothetical protein
MATHKHNLIHSLTLYNFLTFIQKNKKTDGEADQF